MAIPPRTLSEWLFAVTVLGLCMLVVFAAMGFGYWTGLLEAGWAVCPAFIR